MKTRHGFIALIGVALLASAAMVGCSKDSGKESGTEKELLKQSLRTFVCLDDIDLNRTETNIVSAEAFEETLDSYLKTFSGKAYIAVNINNESSDFYDITLIPMVSDCGKAISKKINGLSETKLATFSSKDKDKFNNWVNQQQKEGNIVVTYYDEKTGEYHAISYTKLEWSLLKM